MYNIKMKYNPSNCISARLAILQRKVSAVYRNYLAPLGITESQSSILMILAEHNEISQSEIGNILHLERSSLSRNMVRLEKNGWIIKDASYHPTWKLTGRGNKFMSKLMPAWEQAMNEIDSIIGKQGWNHLSQFEQKLT